MLFILSEFQFLHSFPILSFLFILSKFRLL
jgi:hypothetical protein